MDDALVGERRVDGLGNDNEATVRRLCGIPRHGCRRNGKHGKRAQ